MALIKCETCGKSISDLSDKCIHCGEPIKKYRICSECNEKYEVTLMTCPNCGKKESFHDLNSNDAKIVAKDKLKNIIDFKKNTKAKILVIISILLVIAGIIFLPGILKPYTSYIEEGNFEKAYEKAKDEDKKKVLYENLLTYISADVEDGLKNPSSFVLKNNYYYDEEYVLEINGTNTYGAVVTEYWYYTYDEEDNAYELYTSLSDFEEETYSIYWDSYSEILEIILKNAAKKTVKEIISDSSNKMDDAYVERINKKHELGILKNTVLISQVYSIYPANNNTM